MSALGPTGEAPQLSNPSYGRYDNGAKVFSTYDNFTGQTISSLWYTTGCPVSSCYYVNNGLTFLPGIVSGAEFSYQNAYSGNLAVDAYESTNALISSGPRFGVGYGLLTTNYAGGSGFVDPLSGALGFVYSTGTYIYAPGAAGNSITSSESASTYYVFSLLASSTIDGFSVNYGSPVAYAYSQTLSSLYPGMGADTDGVVPEVTGVFAYWFRTRAYPPGGVMPSSSLGTYAPPTVTLTFTAGNSIPYGNSDNAIGTTSQTGDTIQIKYCVGSGSSCTPSTLIIATNAIGSNTVTNSISFLPIGNFILDACDTTQSACSATNTVTIAPLAVTLTFSSGNSVIQGVSDNAIGTTSVTGDIVQLKYCVGSGSSCTPLTVLATNAIGSASVTNTLAYLPLGNYIIAANDITAGISSATNTITVTSTSILQYVPIVVSNLQSTATPAPFQQMLTIPSSTYTNINSGWSNVEFTSGNYLGGSGSTAMQAWVENGAVNTAPSTAVWVNLPNGLGAAGGGSNSITIYMNMMGSNVMSSSGPTGEAPQLSASYGQYDNGASVFTQYGGGGPTGWSQFTYVGGTWTTASGYLQQTNSIGSYNGGPAALIEGASYPIIGNYILESAFSYTIQASARVGIVAVVTPISGDAYGYRFIGEQGGAGAGFLTFLNDWVAWVVQSSYPGAVSTPYTMSVTDAAGTWSGNLYSGNSITGSVLTSLSPTAYSIANYQSATTGYVGLSAGYGNGVTVLANPIAVQWFRMRAYPPGGVMPSTSIGASPTTVSLTFTNGNSIMQGITDNAVGTTTGTGDTIQLKYCVGSGSSCTPTTVLATNAIGSNTVTNSISYLPVGNYIFAANDLTKGITSATNTVTIIGPPTLVYDVPITIANLQTTATPAPFQQLLNVPSSTYSSYINANWMNVEFTSGNYVGGIGNTPLQSWIESGAANNAASTIVWVNLPSGLGAAGSGNSITVYMNFVTPNVMSASGPTGEAPQISASYGQYDNGADVFNNYWNFAGTSLTVGTQTTGGGWSTYCSNTSYCTETNYASQNNGLTIPYASGAQNYDFFWASAFAANSAFDWYGTPPVASLHSGSVSSYENGGFGFVIGNPGTDVGEYPQTGLCYPGGSGCPSSNTIPFYTVAAATWGSATSFTVSQGVWSTVISGSSLYQQFNYGTAATQSGTLTANNIGWGLWLRHFGWDLYYPMG